MYLVCILDTLKHICVVTRANQLSCKPDILAQAMFTKGSYQYLNVNNMYHGGAAGTAATPSPLCFTEPIFFEKGFSHTIFVLTDA